MRERVFWGGEIVQRGLIWEEGRRYGYPLELIEVHLENAIVANKENLERLEGKLGSRKLF